METYENTAATTLFFDATFSLEALIISKKMEKQGGRTMHGQVNSY